MTLERAVQFIREDELIEIVVHAHDEDEVVDVQVEF